LLDNLPIAGIPRALSGTSAPFEYGNYNDFEVKLNSLITEVGVVIMEPMRYQCPDNDFLAHVAKRCSEKSIALIFDEISSGFRFENGLASSTSGVTPDAVVLSKALGNGYPIAAVAGSHSFMSAAKDSFISSTTHTESIGFAAMSAVLDFYRQNDVAATLGERGAAVKNILMSAAQSSNIEISIKGLDQLWSWSFGVDADSERYLQTICTELMLSRSILFSNRVYATLGMLETNMPLLENSLNETFMNIKRIMKSGKDLKTMIKHSPNKLGIY
jgi:glutamate-1-semialdehyde 2,1-aminomutase